MSGTTITGLTLLNHADSLHNNYFLVDMTTIDTHLPAPLRLELTNTDETHSLNDLWIGSLQFSTLSGLPKLVYQAEDADGGTTVSSADASEGAFQRHTWSDAGWTDLTHWELASSDLEKYQGRSVLAMLRLANPHAYVGMLMKLAVRIR